jgi:hypothetical protein
MANTTITTVSTSQSPDAKPVAKSLELTTNFTPLIEVPNFNIPELIFGGTTVTAPGVAEVISPLILSNKTANTVYVDIQVYRFEDYSTEPPTSVSASFSIATNLPIGAYDIITFPLNGQFFYNGDRLDAKADQNNSIDATISFTLGQAEEYLES